MNRTYYFFVLVFLMAFTSAVKSQIIVNGQERFGNEWIDYTKDYYKFEVSADGLYRIDKATLQNAGFPVNTVPMSDFQLFWLGDEVAIYTSTEGIMGDNDFVEFYGEKMRTELDINLYENPDHILNREVALYSEVSAYFLTTTSGGNHVRIQELENDLTGALPPALDWYWQDDVYEMREEWVKALTHTNNVQFSKFESGEGFGSSISDEFNDFVLETNNVFNNGLQGRLRYRLTGNSTRSTHEVNVSWNNMEMASHFFIQNAIVDTTVNIDINDISNTNNLAVHSQVVASGETKDRNSVGELSLSYPRNFDGQNLSIMRIRLESSNNPVYLEIQNFNSSGSTPFLYSTTRNTKTLGVLEDGLVKFLLPNVTANERFILLSELAIGQASFKRKHQFEDLRSSNSDYLIITHNTLMDDSNGVNHVQAYADYRGSQIGGSYRTQIIDINDLSDQFAYGVYLSPFSIKNFSNFAKESWSNLKFIYLMGKSIKYSELKFSEELQSINLLPSFGEPASDNFLFSQGHEIVPNFAIGRLSAHNGRDVANYLDKVVTFDQQINSGEQTIEDKVWLKRILHTSGGNDNESPGQKEQLRNNLQVLADIATMGNMGATTYAYHSISNETIEEVPESSEAFEILNDGVMMKTYLGHGGAETVQLNLFEDPSGLTNTDRYPIMTALGCHTGDAFVSNSNSLGERNVLAEKKGGVMYIATSGLGYIHELHNYGLNWYSKVTDTLYGTPVGLAIRQSIAELVGNNNQLLMEQLIVQGDPAIRMATFEGPDYTIDYSSVSINPTVVNRQDDSYELNFTVYNLGRNPQLVDSIEYRITHRLPDGTLADPIVLKDKAPEFSRDIVLTMPNQGDNSIGINTILITVDPMNQITELPNPAAEDNNELRSDIGVVGFDFFVVDNGVRTIYPLEFAIVNSEETALTASTLNPLALEQTYIFELDTTALFNSTSKRSSSVTQSGGVLKWVPQNLTPETVYYWRVSPDSTATFPQFAWSESSFTYLPESSEGWNQGHYYQYLENDLRHEYLDSCSRTYKLFNEGMHIRFDLGHDVNFGNWVNFDGIPFASINPALNESTIGIFAWQPDAQTRFYKSGTDFNFGSIAHSRSVFLYKMTSTEDRKNVIDLLNAMPDEAQIFFFTIIVDNTADYNTIDWESDSQTLETNIFEYLESYGATQIRNMASVQALPYVYGFTKGKGKIIESIGSTLDESISAETNVISLSNDGEFETAWVGPASSWGRIYWEIQGEPEINDSIVLTMFGYDSKADPEGDPLLTTNLLTGEVLDITEISASTHPYFKLVINSTSEGNRTIPHIPILRVNFDGLPDAAINPARDYSFERDTITQGELLTFKVAIDNITTRAMDSLDVRYSVASLDDNSTIVSNNKLAPLEELSSISSTFDHSTINLSGRYNLSLEVNPQPGQAELHRFNNLLLKPFYVEGDGISPLLDVTFDGIHILDGDLVSSKPFISISLEDENTFLLLDDTMSFEMKYIYPDSRIVPIYFSDDEVSFSPASQSSRNEAKVELSHTFVEDGVYTLEIQGRDKSGNTAGEVSYKVSFEIITASSITQVINYPNPFSTKTQFVYTLTGDSPPDFYKIQVITSSGKIVREITQDDIGPLKVGRHKTDYTWDGTDEYGDKLANGVYLYRFVHENSDGSTFDRRATTIDSYFKNDFGKLVILR